MKKNATSGVPRGDGYIACYILLRLTKTTMGFLNGELCSEFFLIESSRNKALLGAICRSK